MDQQLHESVWMMLVFKSEEEMEKTNEKRERENEKQIFCSKTLAVMTTTWTSSTEFI